LVNKILIKEIILWNSRHFLIFINLWMKKGASLMMINLIIEIIF
jgi:hypothetical protein